MRRSASTSKRHTIVNSHMDLLSSSVLLETSIKFLHRIPAKRYKGVAHVPSQRARKGFNLKFNPNGY